MMSFMVPILTKYYWGDQVKKSNIGRACGTYGKQERCIQGSDEKT